MKKALYISLKAFSVLNIFKFLPWLFVHVKKKFDKKDEVNLKFYEVTTLEGNNCNTHIVQYLKKQSQSKKFGQLRKYNM